MRFAQPALQLPEPNVLRLEVAPVNVQYGQTCFAAALAFADAAWPDTAFDPLRVLASMTLAAAVQVNIHVCLRSDALHPRHMTCASELARQWDWMMLVISHIGLVPLASRTSLHCTLECRIHDLERLFCHTGAADGADGAAYAGDQQEAAAGGVSGITCLPVECHPKASCI